MSTVPSIFSHTSTPSGHLSELANSVADFVERSGGVARTRRLRSAGREHDTAVWKQMGALGWLGILVPEKHGGLGLGLGEMAVVAEGLARALAPEPLSTVAVLAAEVLVAVDNEALQEELLPRLVQGELVAALAWQEAAGILDPGAIDTRAVRGDGGYRLSGCKHYILGAAHADGFIVSAGAPDGIALFWLPRDAQGTVLQVEPVADGRSFGVLTLKDVVLPERYCAAKGLAASAALARSLDHAIAIAGVELFGVMSQTLDMTLDYMRTRVQFGKPIGSFQALQHRAVDLYIQARLCGAVLEDGILALARNPDARTRAALASRIKARCSDAGLRITREAIQLHGAIGFTDELDVGLFLKRALVLAAWLGNGAQHRRRYAALTVARES